MHYRLTNACASFLQGFIGYVLLSTLYDVLIYFENTSERKKHVREVCTASVRTICSRNASSTSTPKASSDSSLALTAPEWTNRRSKLSKTGQPHDQSRTSNPS